MNNEIKDKENSRKHFSKHFTCVMFIGCGFYSRLECCEINTICFLREERIMDYSKDITISELDLANYEAKFKLCDAYLSGEDYLLPLLLKDPTKFAYLYYKNNEGERLKVYAYQDAILNDSHRFIYFRAANQIGKSLTFNVKAARNLAIDHGHSHNEAIVSKSLPQSTFQMRRIKSLLNSMRGVNWKDVPGSSDSMSVISVDILDDAGKYKYSNTLICAPCTEGLLGYDLHEIDLDEFEYWDIDIKWFFNQIAQPRTYTTKGRILIMSNPNGQDNFGAELEAQTLVNGERKWHVYVFNYLDKPGNTMQEYLELKHNLPRREFESTVAAIRSSSSRNYFTAEEIERSYDVSMNVEKMVGQQPFFFLDVGSTHDQCCLVGGFVSLDDEYDEKKDDIHNRRHIHLNIPIIHLYPRGYPLSRVVGSFSERMDSDGWHYEKSVKEYLNEWSASGIKPELGCDVTGNSGIVPLFDSVGINATDVVYSGPSKSGYYQRFKYMMEKGLIHRIRHKDWEHQASVLVAVKSARGYNLINAASTVDRKGQQLDSRLKKTPDDCMDATAGLIELVDSIKRVPVTLAII